MEYLEKNKFYMNPMTGSVALGEEWENDFKENPSLDTWEEWGGDTLFHVVKDHEEEWIDCCLPVLKLVQTPYISDRIEHIENPHYTAHAEDELGNEFHIFWEVKEGFEEVEDESESCDWEDFKVTDSLGESQNPEHYQIDWSSINNNA